MVDFIKTESYIRNLFVKGEKFVYQGMEYTISVCDKPRPAHGECKTDVYVEAVDGNDEKKEFKISVKQRNAAFVENKVKLGRAIEILGEDAQGIIEKSIIPIRKAFEDDCLIYFEEGNNTDALSIRLGWRFDFLNSFKAKKPGKNESRGKRSGVIELTEQQKLNIYAGIGACAEKRNCMVNGRIIENSGVANYVIVVDDCSMTLEYYLNNMMPIEEFIRFQELYFSCRASNYRCAEDKVEGNRDLAVYIDWSIKEGKLCAEFVYEKPLSVNSAIVCANLKQLLIRLGINRNNFSNLKSLLDPGVKIFDREEEKPALQCSLF